MRQRYCKQCSGWHDLEAWPRACIPERESKRSPLGVPYIRTDGMSAIYSHADGQMYDSKSAYYASVKAQGLEIVGNEKLTPKAPPEPSVVDIQRDVKTAIEQVEAKL